MHGEGLTWRFPKNCTGVALEVPSTLLLFSRSINLVGEKDCRKKRVTVSLKGRCLEPCFHFSSPSSCRSLHLFLPPNADSTPSVPVRARFHLIRLSTVAGTAARLTTKNQSCIFIPRGVFLIRSNKSVKCPSFSLSMEDIVCDQE